MVLLAMRRGKDAAPGSAVASYLAVGLNQFLKGNVIIAISGKRILLRNG